METFLEQILNSLRTTLPGLIDQKCAKTETENANFKTSCYWVGKVLRIDIKPK